MEALREIRDSLASMPKGKEHRRLRRLLAVKFDRTEDAIEVIVRRFQKENALGTDIHEGERDLPARAESGTGYPSAA